MNYPRSLFYNFLTVYFANHLLPGIDIVSQTKIPHLGADLPFAVILGVLNFLIYPVLHWVKGKVTGVQIALIALCLNFIAYASLKILPIGIQVSSIEGYFITAAVVTVGSFIINFLIARAHTQKKIEPLPVPEAHSHPEHKPHTPA